MELLIIFIIYILGSVSRYRDMSEYGFVEYSEVIFWPYYSILDAIWLFKNYKL